ncbi:hypothetical protein EON65_35465 [archaeon]|nr:MAG: hypothetical protein EON65_35465 [archaeon]
MHCSYEDFIILSSLAATNNNNNQTSGSWDVEFIIYMCRIATIHPYLTFNLAPKVTTTHYMYKQKRSSLDSIIIQRLTSLTIPTLTST